MDDRIMRLTEVTTFTGRSRSSLLRDMAAGRFPRPVKIGPRAIGWRASSIRQWMDELEGGAPNTFQQG